jgi:uncharacterized protein involved in exopolysaccharide biosynthesis
MSTLTPNENAPLKKQTLPLPAHEYMEDEINLLDLALVIAKHKRMILKFTLIAAVAVAGISLLIPNTYRGEVLLAPAQSEDVPAGGLSALGGLASLAGVSIGGGSSMEENLAVIQSRDFLWQFVQENKLMTILFEDEWDEELKKWEEEDPADQPGPFDVYRLMIEDKVLSVTSDDDTGLVVVAIDWQDAALAAQWANTLVARANKFLAEKAIARSQGNLQYLNDELMRTQVEEFRKTLFDLIASEQKNAMMASAQKDYAFRVLDPALVPDEKTKPKRALIVILAAFVACFMAIVWAFIREGITRSGQDPEQEQRMRELRQALRWKE